MKQISDIEYGLLSFQSVDRTPSHILRTESVPVDSRIWIEKFLTSSATDQQRTICLAC
jgi:hypothetical protein